MDPKESDTMKYIEEHKIAQLMDNLTSSIIFTQPGNPKKFMIDYLKKLRESRKSGMDEPTLLSEENLNSVFDTLDPVKRGHISLQQYTSALQTIGVKEFNKTPPGHEMNKINKPTFLFEAKKGLQVNAATYKSLIKNNMPLAQTNYDCV